MAMIKVVCGIIHKEGKVLICRRKPEKSLGGYWEFPGGKVEPEESQIESLKRELLEELQLEVEIQDFFYASEHQYENFSIELIAYTCVYKESNMILTDHDQIEWVGHSELLDWKLSPADIPLAVRLMQVLT
jgi:8-oxo-dGTP diphosphatase